MKNMTRTFTIAYLLSMAFTIGCSPPPTPEADLPPPFSPQTGFQEVRVDPPLLTNSTPAPSTNAFTVGTFRRPDGTELKGEIKWQSAND